MSTNQRSKVGKGFFPLNLAILDEEDATVLVGRDDSVLVEESEISEDAQASGNVFGNDAFNVSTSLATNVPDGSFEGKAHVNATRQASKRYASLIMTQRWLTKPGWRSSWPDARNDVSQAAVGVVLRLVKATACVLLIFDDDL